jgi:hypothetical protein
VAGLEVPSTHPHHLAPYLGRPARISGCFGTLQRIISRALGGSATAHVAVGSRVDGAVCFAPDCSRGFRFRRRQRALHRLARCIGKCMGLFRSFRCDPTPRLHVAHDGLAARVNVHMLDRYPLSTLAAMMIERLQ